jgi:adenosylmethionine-8-amino-7-oxononanoate aminotransferase
MKAAAELCKKHNVLFIIDEVQTGFGRCGTTLCHHHEPDVKPDMVCLGKALTGGIINILPLKTLFKFDLLTQVIRSVSSVRCHGHQGGYERYRPFPVRFLFSLSI